MCRGIREAKFTWVGSKYRLRNKIRTLAWVSLQASLVLKSHPVLFQPLNCGALSAYPAHHNCDECVKRSDARNFIPFVLVSLLVYNYNGLHLFFQCESGDHEVAGDATDASRRRAAEIFILSCCCFAFVSVNGSQSS